MTIFCYIFYGLLLLWIIITRIRKTPYVISLPNFWYSGITIGWLIIVRKKDLTERLLVHEYIHFLQQRETFIIGAYLIYITDLIIKSIYYKSIYKGYQQVAFEREARLFESTKDYVFKRKPYIWKYFLKMDVLTTITKDSTDEQITALFDLGKGNIFKYSGDYSTVKRKIDSHIPDNIEFTYTLVKPGSSLYAQYGAKTFVIVNA